MKRFGIIICALVFIVGLCGAVFAADTLETVKKKGVLVALRKLGRREARRLLSSKTVKPSSNRLKTRTLRRRTRK